MTWFMLLVDLYRTAQYVTSMKLCDLFWKTAKGKYIQCKCRRIDSKVKKGLSFVIFSWRNAWGRHFWKSPTK